MTRKALVIGIKNYPNFRGRGQRQDLENHPLDAKAIADFLRKFGRFEVEVLPKTEIDGAYQVDEKGIVTAKQLKNAIYDLFVDPKDGKIPQTALLFFAGHGLAIEEYRKTIGYLCTSDTNKDQEKWGVEFRWLAEQLGNSQVSEQIIWLDCCHSGHLTQQIFEQTNPGNRDDIKRSIIASCRDSEISLGVDGHGVLTHLLKKVLHPEQYDVSFAINSSEIQAAVEREFHAHPKFGTYPQRPLFFHCGRPIHFWEGRGKQSDRKFEISSANQPFWLADSLQNDSPSLNNSELSWFCSLREDPNVYDRIRKAYQDSLPPDAGLWDLEGNNLHQILQELKVFRRLFEFFNRLSKDENLPEEIRDRFKNWAERLEPKKYPDPINSSDRELESYLIAKIEPDEGSDKFLVNAWLIMDNSIPANNLFRFESLIDGNEHQQGIVCQFNQIPEKLNEFLKKSRRNLRGRKYNLTIEVFVPSDLMCTEVDRWKIIDPIDDEATLGIRYPIRLRSVERLQIDYLDAYLSDWYKQWERVKNIFHKEPTPELFETIEKMENFNWKMLKNSLMEKIGLKLTCAHPQGKRKELFKAILTATTPIAIWTRCDIPNVDQVADTNSP